MFTQRYLAAGSHGKRTSARVHARGQVTPALWRQVATVILAEGGEAKPRVKGALTLAPAALTLLLHLLVRSCHLVSPSPWYGKCSTLCGPFFLLSTAAKRASWAAAVR